MIVADSAPDHVHAVLRREILQGVIAPEATLRQEDIAERFGVSRTPIRQAFERLQSERLVEVLPSRRVRVSPLTREELIDVYDMRAALEPLAAALATPNLTPALLRDAAHALEAADAEDDVVSFGARNARFHLLLEETYGRPRLLAEIRSLLDISDRYQCAAVGFESHSSAVRREHRAMLAAARNGDSERAAIATRAHIESSRERLLVALSLDRGRLR